MSKTVNSVTNWIESSNYDIKTAEHLFATKRYVYVLFMCHLATEKLLKAVFEVALKKSAPKTHNLIQLVNEVGIIVPEDHLKTLSLLNDLSIVTRYPEDMKALVKAFKRDRVLEYLIMTKGLLKWLKRDKRLKK
jgi:HEPN domain-containing protein